MWWFLNSLVAHESKFDEGYVSNDQMGLFWGALWMLKEASSLKSPI